MRLLRLAPNVGAVFAYLTKDDVLLIIMILITGLQLLFDYLKNRKEQ